MNAYYKGILLKNNTDYFQLIFHDGSGAEVFFYKKWYEIPLLLYNCPTGEKTFDISQNNIITGCKLGASNSLEDLMLYLSYLKAICEYIIIISCRKVMALWYQ